MIKPTLTSIAAATSMKDCLPQVVAVVTPVLTLVTFVFMSYIPLVPSHLSNYQISLCFHFYNKNYHNDAKMLTAYLIIDVIYFVSIDPASCCGTFC